MESVLYIKNKNMKHIANCSLFAQVSGAAIPKPVSSFGHLGFPEVLLKVIRRSTFTQPTPIQAQGIPIALMGRDIIGKIIH